MANPNQHPSAGLVDATLQNLKNLVDVNTIIGDTIQLPDGTSRRINASIGLAFAQRESERMEDLINRADRAMYRVKRTEKNGIAIYDKTDEAGPV